MDVVANLFNNCDPLKPPPEGTYVDLYPARGDAAIVSMLGRRIRRAATHTHLLFSGHPGSGKSTELLRLCERLAPQLPSLLDEINLVLEKARAELKKRGYQDLVLVVDNLEKIPDVRDPATGHGTHYWLFIASGEQLNSIAAHTVLTVPLQLIYSTQHASLMRIFG
jgi:hypothetical protein